MMAKKLKKRYIFTNCPFFNDIRKHPLKNCTNQYNDVIKNLKFLFCNQDISILISLAGFVSLAQCERHIAISLTTLTINLNCTILMENLDYIHICITLTHERAAVTEFELVTEILPINNYSCSHKTFCPFTSLLYGFVQGNKQFL